MSYESHLASISKNIREYADVLDQLVALERSIGRFSEALVDNDNMQFLFPILFDYKNCLLEKLATPPWQPLMHKNSAEQDVRSSKKPVEATVVGSLMTLHDEVDLNAVSLYDFLKNMRRQYVEHAVKRHSGNIKKTAQSLGLTRQSIYSALKPTKISDDSPTITSPDVSTELQ